MSLSDRIKYCPNCMQRVSPETPKCARCGFGLSEYSHPGYALPIGSLLHDGRYQTGRVLGQGGFGITYLGIDKTLHMKVAIKEYFPSNLASRSNETTEVEWHTSAEQRDRGRESFLKEALHMAKINQIPGVVQVKTVFYQNKTAYIIMDYIDGQTLSTWLSEHGPMKVRQCVSVLEPVMTALQEAHQRGLIHRDVSPDNIMIQRENGRVWLLDMGAAKEIPQDRKLPNFSPTTHLVFKNGFSPPEQYMDSGKIGPWTDVYAMSATIYYCLTGTLVPDAVSRISRDELRFPPSIPVSTAHILRKGLAVDPKNRIQSMKELIGELRGILPPPNPVLEMIRKRRASIAALFVAMILLSGLFFFWNIAGNRAQRGGAVQTPVTVTHLGNSNANMRSYGGYVRRGNEYLYFIGADNALYVCPFNTESGSFHLKDSVKACDFAAYITAGSSAIYYMTTDYETMDICSMELDGSDSAAIYSSVRDDGRVFSSLQYAQFSDEREYLYFMIENAELTRLSSLYRYDLRGKRGVLETVVDGNLLWYNLGKDAIYYTESVNGSYKLMRCDLDGRGIYELTSLNRFDSGFVEEDTLFLYSDEKEAVLPCNLDGTRKKGAAGEDLLLKTGSVCGYGGGWLFYSDGSNIRRMRTDGTDDGIIIQDCTAAAICYDNQWLWLAENRSNDIYHQVESRVMMAYQDGSKLVNVQGPLLSWGLNPAIHRDIEYQIREDGGLTLTAYTGDGKRFSIPETIDGRSVVEIGAYSLTGSSLVELGLPWTIHTIGEHAFENSEDITFIGLPDSLVSIGAYAFANCRNLSEVTIPDSVRFIGENAFSNTAVHEIKVAHGCVVEDVSVSVTYYAVANPDGGNDAGKEAMEFATPSDSVETADEEMGTEWMQSPSNNAETETADSGGDESHAKQQLLAGHTICIDPGHSITPLSGKGYKGPVSPLSDEQKPLYTEGTHGKNQTEEYLNLVVGLKLRDALRKLGAEVIMTREVSEITLTGIERCEIANRGGAEVNIHIHADGVDNPSANGVSVLVPAEGLLGTPSILDESVRLGQLMVDSVAEETGAKNRGISPRSDMSGFNFSEVPSVLIEMGFMTNPKEDAMLETDEYQNKIVNGMVKSLLKWYGIQ